MRFQHRPIIRPALLALLTAFLLAACQRPGASADAPLFRETRPAGLAAPSPCRVAPAHLPPGGRQAPNTWQPLPTAGAPRARLGQSAVWTGRALLIWGGWTDASMGMPGLETALGDGAAYNPLTRMWAPLPTAGAPSPRLGQTAVWTGKELLVWGGRTFDNQYLTDGARYDPAAGAWTRMRVAGSSIATSGYSAVWTGAELLIWGGSGFLGRTDSGAAYNPASNTWRPLPSAGAPSPREGPAAVWTGRELLVWGGTTASGVALHDGGRYDPVSNTWSPLSAVGAPDSAAGAAVWAGRELLIWDGERGAAYDPVAQHWRTISTAGAPRPRGYFVSVWTGRDLIIWGGEAVGQGATALLDDGARYDPAADTWAALPTTGAPAGGPGRTAVWTGSAMLVWGGDCQGSPNGAQYRPPLGAARSANATPCCAAETPPRLPAAAGTSAATPTPAARLGTLEGAVEFLGDPCAPSPAPPAGNCTRPYGQYAITVYAADGRTAVAQTTTDAKGNYRLALPPGVYVLYTRNGVDPDHPTRHRATVYVGDVTRLYLTWDSGAR